MARPLFALILFISMVLIANAQWRCPKNQEWTSCGRACPSTCANPSGQPCSKQCYIGCQCKKGYVLTRKGRGFCIPIDQC